MFWNILDVPGVCVSHSSNQAVSGAALNLFGDNMEVITLPWENLGSVLTLMPAGLGIPTVMLFRNLFRSVPGHIK